MYTVKILKRSLCPCVKATSQTWTFHRDIVAEDHQQSGDKGFLQIHQVWVKHLLTFDALCHSDSIFDFDGKNV